MKLIIKILLFNIACYCCYGQNKLPVGKRPVFAFESGVLYSRFAENNMGSISTNPKITYENTGKPGVSTGISLLFNPKGFIQVSTELNSYFVSHRVKYEHHNQNKFGTDIITLADYFLYSFFARPAIVMRLQPLKEIKIAVEGGIYGNFPVFERIKGKIEESGSVAILIHDTNNTDGYFASKSHYSLLKNNEIDPGLISTFGWVVGVSYLLPIENTDISIRFRIFIDSEDIMKDLDILHKLMSLSVVCSINRRNL